MNLEPEPERLMLQLALILVLTMINAFFASAEMAMVSVNKNKIKKLSQENNSNARLLETLMEEPSKFLATIQVGITLAGFLSSASAATGIASQLSSVMQVPYGKEISMVVVTIILSYFTLVFGELIPKRIALENAEKIALSSAKPVYFVAIFTKPFIKILSLSTGLILKIMGYKDEATEEKVSEEEIRSIISQSEEDGSIEKDEKDMIESIFEFNDKSSKEIMTSRKDTFLIDIDDDILKNIDEILSQSYTRIPIYEDSIDNVIGILHIKDLLIEAKKVGFENVNIRNIMHKPFFVPKTKKTNELFKVLQANRVHIALLVDEYGGFCGIVTMEDLIEEIMGDIEDEYDLEENDIIKVDENTFIVDCSIPLCEFNEIFNLKLKEGEYDTLNGYIINKLGEIPQKNEDVEIEEEKINIKVIKTNNKKIENVRISYV
ncbi:hemolysin family protein [Romboutsia sp.]|uniref:hemolysin family protein n=1 Tax=Romboutsia sp. TaxID=1965302 RepID=UPI003F389D26